MTVTRFAPSPTGYLHVGNLRTAVLNWLLARKNGGTFILRIDDTDPERSREEYADQIRRDLEWLGLTWDREERQSSRLERYHAAADRLREAGRLYECFETPTELDLKRKKQLAAGRPPVYDRSALQLSDASKATLRADRGPGHWRFLLDRVEVRFRDLIRGDQRIDAASLSDPVLIRADGQFLYTLASVVDDSDMGVTHVVRGADHVTNSGTQTQIFQALDAEPPLMAHNSLLTDADGGALSKRLGTLALKDLRDQGIEPMALVAYMARLGSSLPVEVITDPTVLIDTFEIGQFGLAPTKFDPADLAQHSAKTLRSLSYEAVKSRLSDAGVPSDMAPALWEAVGPNLDRFDEIAEWWALCRHGTDPVVDPEDAAYVKEAIGMLPDRPWDTDTWGAWTAALKEATGRKGRGLFQPLRKALTGRAHGPDMALLLPLLQRAGDG
ncbi:MAG: glutamate--tRNA ligase [Pseudomonadota bacterium]